MNAELEILPDIEAILKNIPSSVYNDVDLKEIHDSLSAAAKLINRVLDAIHLSSLSKDDPIRIRILSFLNLFVQKINIHFTLRPYVLTQK